jgi:DNA processing protein
VLVLWALARQRLLCALGIDAAAHRGAMSEKGATIAFLGVAIDRIYPTEHLDLFRDIVQRGGALVSEHPSMSTTYAYDHAKRNRLIAAQSRSVIVAEAGVASGAMVTARDAQKLGRLLYVPPEAIGGERGGIQELEGLGAREWTHH